MSILVLMAFFTGNGDSQPFTGHFPAAPQQRGQGALEFTLAAVPVLLTALGGIEAVHWYAVRETVNQALMQGLRAGITQNARPEPIKLAFDQSLLLLFPPSSHGSAQYKQQLRYASHTQHLGAPWHMQIVSPGPLHYAAHADPTVTIGQRTGLPAIRNSYQKEQHLQRNNTPAGAAATGPNSTMAQPDIFQANTLTLKVIYPHSPLLPGMRGLFRLAGNVKGTLAQRTLAAGYLPIVQEQSLPMQSDPVQWPVNNTPGFYSHQQQAGGPEFGIRPNENLACKGIWCGNKYGTNETWPGTDGPPQANNPKSALPHLDKPVADEPGQPLELAPNDPQCGVTVCCLSEQAV